jgi:hypothetical protein
MRPNQLFSALVFALVLAVIIFSPAQAVSSKGKRFYFAFQPNIYAMLSQTVRPSLTVLISSEESATGTVKVPGLGFTAHFNVVPGELARISVPLEAADHPWRQVVNRAVIVEADKDITVYGLNRNAFTTDAFLALPVEAASKHFRAMTFFSHADDHNQATIVGIYDNTEVTVRPLYRSRSTEVARDGVPFTITLNSGDIYTHIPVIDANGRWTWSWDISGTMIDASAPVALMGGAKCADVPVSTPFCDHIAEQIPPVSNWGTIFMTVPIATRLNGDVIRVLASEDGTTININGEDKYTLKAGHFRDLILAEPSIIKSTAPILVAQYTTGSRYDGVVGDPFMMLVPPAEQYLDSYGFISLSEQEGFPVGYINLIAPSSDIASIVMDGENIDPSLFSPIGSSGYSGAQVPVAPGSHVLKAAAPVGLFVYGFGDYDSYGYPGGMNFDLINSRGDSFPPNVRIIQFESRAEVLLGDSEDINLNGILDPGEDMNGNGIIDRRSEDVNQNGVLDPGEDLNGDGVIDRDTGIFRIGLDDAAENLVLDLGQFVPGSLHASVTVRPINPALPARGDLVVQDGAGNTVRQNITFTSSERIFSDVRLVSTLSSTDIDLDSSSFSVPPDSITAEHGKTVLEWYFDAVSIGELEQLGYDVVLRNAAPNEDRLVTHNLELFYSDIDGQPVHRSFGERRVSVLPSLFEASLSASSLEATAHQSIQLTGMLRNLGPADTESVYEIVLLDSAGQPVSVLMPKTNLLLAGDEVQALPTLSFNIGGLYLGEYIVRLLVRDAAGTHSAQDQVTIRVVPDGQPLYAAKISTDKQQYAANQTVVVSARISNPSANAILENAEAIIRIQGPGTGLLWESEQPVPTIHLGAFHDYQFDVPLGGAAPGQYRATLDVRDQTGTVRASSEYAFELTSSQQTGAGLSAAITLDPSATLRTEQLTVTASLSNQGNSTLTDIPLLLRIVDASSRQVLAALPLGEATLAIGGTAEYTASWIANVVAGRQYVAMLEGSFAAGPRILATAPLEVSEKLLSSMATDGRGRLLVLLDDADVSGDQCTGLSELGIRFDTDTILREGSQLRVELLDQSGQVLDIEQLEIDYSARNQNQAQSLADEMIISEVSAGAVSITLLPAGSVASLGGNSYQLRLTSQGEAGERVWQSDLFSTACGEVAKGQSVSTGFRVSRVYGMDRPEPYGPQSAPGTLTQRRAIESILEHADWQFTMVNSGDAFAEELASGGYAVALLLSEQVKLAESVQSLLVARVADGMGLVVAGQHDNRNGRIDEALGVKQTGKLTGITGVTIQNFPSVELTAPLSFRFGPKPDRVSLDGAMQLATFSGGKGAGTAISRNRHGDGEAIYFAFDLLIQAAAENPQDGWKDLLLAALADVHPEQSLLQAGNATPITLQIENLGLATIGEVRIQLPAGMQLIDAGSGAISPDGSLYYPFAVDHDEVESWTFRVRLPEQPGQIVITGAIRVQDVAGEWVDYGLVEAKLDVVSQ